MLATSRNYEEIAEMIKPLARPAFPSSPEAIGHTETTVVSRLVSVCPMGLLAWEPGQGGKFRETAGRELWGKQASDLRLGGSKADKLDVVLWVAVNRDWIARALLTHDGRALVRIIRPVDLWEPEIEDGSCYLRKKFIKQVYVLKAGAELKVDGEEYENASRFTSAQFETAWHAKALEIPTGEKLTMHFTCVESAKLILGEGSHGIKASKRGQGGGGLSLVVHSSSTSMGPGSADPSAPRIFAQEAGKQMEQGKDEDEEEKSGTLPAAAAAGAAGWAPRDPATLHTLHTNVSQPAAAAAPASEPEQKFAVINTLHTLHTNVSQPEQKFAVIKMVMGSAASSDLKHFIGLDDRALANILRDPLTAMTEEWYAKEPWNT